MKHHSPGFLELVQDAKTRIREISVKQVVQKQKNKNKFVFIDVREESEWNESHAKGAIHIGKGILERDIENKVKNFSTEIVLYCGGGFRSALSADSLQKMGYKKVFSMAGGWKAWKQNNAPTETASD